MVACSGTLQPLISSDIVERDWCCFQNEASAGLQHNLLRLGTLNGIINHLDYIEVRNTPGCMLPLNLLPSLMRESSVLVLLPQSDSDDKLL